MSSEAVERPTCGGRGKVVWSTDRCGILLVEGICHTCWTEAPVGITRRRSIGGRWPGSAQTGRRTVPSGFRRGGGGEKRRRLGRGRGRPFPARSVLTDVGKERTAGAAEDRTTVITSKQAHSSAARMGRARIRRFKFATSSVQR